MPVTLGDHEYITGADRERYTVTPMLPCALFNDGDLDEIVLMPGTLMLSLPAG
jgi:hypothetical protein